MSETLTAKMERNAEAREFINQIRRNLPEAAAMTDEIIRERGFDSGTDIEYIWVEALADVTSMYIRRRNQDGLRKVLTFFSRQFDAGTETVKNCIDASFVENLMWDLVSEDRQWIWSRLPGNLKKLYVAMWGDPF